MRNLLLVTILVSAACSSNKNNNGTGGNGSGADMSAGGGGAGGGSHDMAATAGDMPGTGCDVTTQTGCMSGQKCIPAVVNGNMLGGACVANGTVGDGQPCTPDNSSQTQLNDNCVAGDVCDNDGPNSANTCRKICTADSTCSGTDKCGLLYTRTWGLCLPTCTEFGTDCPAGNDCSVPFDDIASTQTTAVGFFVCKMTGTGALYGACMQDSDCGEGLACDFNNGWCAQDCDSTHACTQPPAMDGGTTTVSCQAYTNLTNGGGFCQ